MRTISFNVLRRFDTLLLNEGSVLYHPAVLCVPCCSASRIRVRAFGSSNVELCQGKVNMGSLYCMHQLFAQYLAIGPLLSKLLLSFFNFGLIAARWTPCCLALSQRNKLKLASPFGGPTCPILDS